MNYIAPVEKAMSELENDYATILIGSQTLESAQNYDCFYHLYREVNLYLYKAAYDYTAATFLKKNKAAELEVITMCTDQWKKSSCHTGLSAAVVKKYTGVHCPVDVYVFDAQGNPLLEIINEEIVTCDNSITAMTFDGKKSVVYPADQDYSIQIVARENGEMSYYVAEITDETSVREVEFYNIPIMENETFNGSVPSELNIVADAYALTSDSIFECDYDSNTDDCADNHTVENWITAAPATCVDLGEIYGECSVCGKRVFEVTPISEIHSETTVENSRNATCKDDGYTGDTVCTICGETIAAGEVLPKETIPHTWDSGAVTVPATCTVDGVKTYTCTVCGATRTEMLSKINHRDGNDDGWCDDCSAELYAHSRPTQPDDPGQNSGENCKYCGQTHSGFMGKLVQFFHNILYFFKNIFR